MSEWTHCNVCGNTHENMTACPTPSIRQPEEERVTRYSIYGLRLLNDMPVLDPLAINESHKGAFGSLSKFLKSKMLDSMIVGYAGFLFVINGNEYVISRREL